MNWLNLWRLGMRIEPGVAAAEADYTALWRNDLELDDWFRLGSESMPFRGGSLDGDGHTISGYFMSKSETGQKCFSISP